MSDSRDDGIDAIIAALAQLTVEHETSPLPPSALHSRLEALTAEAAQLIAGDELDASHLAGLKVEDLKAHLKQRGLPTSGKKAVLAARLLAALDQQPEPSVEEPSASAPPTTVAPETIASELPLEVTSYIPPELREQLDQVVRQHAGKGPQTGIFTDGAVTGNPGPGGWGVVAVVDGSVRWTLRGKEGGTTNNRMEMSAIIAALQKVPVSGAGSDATIYSDSDLCVKTLNLWAEGWERKGWKRSTGPVQNLDLVQAAYGLKRARPNVEIQWRRGHNGDVWNEYADRLACAFRLRGGEKAHGSRRAVH